MGLAPAFASLQARAADEQNPPTEESVESILKKIDASTSLTDEKKALIRGQYEQARLDLKNASEETARAERFSQMARTAPEDLGEIRRELFLLQETPRPDLDTEAVFEELQVDLAELEAALKQWTEELAGLNEEPQRRALRRRDIPKQRALIRKELEDLEHAREGGVDPDAPPEVRQAHTIFLNARAQSIRATLESGDRELEAYQATIDLLPLRRDLAAAQIAVLKREVKELQSILKKRRASEVDEHLRTAKQAADAAPSFLSQQAQGNLGLVLRRRDLRQQSDGVVQQLAEATHAHAQLEKQRTRIEGKVDAVGLTGAIGLMLRKQSATLPNTTTYRRSLQERQPELRAVQFSVLELEDRRADLADLDVALERHAQANAGQPLTEAQLPLLRKTLADERRYLDYLIMDSNAYVDQMLELDRAQQQIVAETENLKRYIDERVLWVRNAEMFGVADVRVATEAGRELVDGRHWRRMLADLFAEMRHNLIPYCLLFLAAALAQILGWQLSRKRSKNELLSDRPTRGARTFRGVLGIVLTVAPLPVLLWLLGRRISALPSDDDLVHACGAGLSGLALHWLPLSALLCTCRSQGFAIRHLGWLENGRSKIHTMLITLMATVLPLTFVRYTLNAQNNARWQDSFGRLCFIVNVLIIAFFVERFLRPRMGVLYQTLRTFPGDWFVKLRWVWYVLGLSAHVGLVAIAWLGYTYAANRLGEQMRTTALLFAALLIVGSMLMHWTRLNIRRLAMRRAAALRTGAIDGPSPIQVEMGLADHGDSWFDDKTSSSKMRPLVSSLLLILALVGLWLIWVDVTPALNVVHRVNLWYTDVVSTEMTSLGDDGVAVIRQAPQRVPVTLGDLLLAVFALLGTMFATRYLAGLFELPMLERLPLDAALQNTITTVTRYALWILAVCIAAAYLGITWSKVQWMAAALTLGLGFGLQEIFANFISGLILLFERPMRVGDVVTIGDTTGVVQAIRMRATTITDWDRKELVVPNKEFATGRLLNWTLTNRTNRRVIQVCVEYGTDPDQVRELLLSIARANARVLDKPAPIALLQEFSDSAMIFTLRVYHAKIADRLRGLHEINTAITHAFRAAGIRFAFPQRDLHLRTSGPTMSWFGPQEEQESPDNEGQNVQA